MVTTWRYDPSKMRSILQHRAGTEDQIGQTWVSWLLHLAERSGVPFDRLREFAGAHGEPPTVLELQRLATALQMQPIDMLRVENRTKQTYE